MIRGVEVISMRLSEARCYLAESGTKEARKALLAKRESVELSQLELAKMSGVQQSAINRIESGKGPLTPRTFARLMTILERESLRYEKKVKVLRDQIETLRGIGAARAQVAMCKQLPWMHSGLADAEARLAALEAKHPSYTNVADALNDPIVRGLLESYERELEHATLPAVERWVDHDFTEHVLRGEQFAVEAQNKWRETGEVMKVRIEKIGTTEE